MNLKKFFTEIVAPVVVAIIIALLIRKFLFFQAKIPTASMYPTIKEGYRVMVTRVYNKEKLNRGDIIVFYSEEFKETYIKRLIGLPGDEIKIENNGDIYINGEKSKEPYVVYPGGARGLQYKVPEGSYFFLGDNRSASKDARYWKQPYISEKDIEGKARFIVFPFDKFGKFVYGKEALK